MSQRDEPISTGFLKLLSVKGCWLIITEITCVTIKPEQWSWLISPYTKRVARRKQEWMQSKATASYDESAPSWNIWMCFITDISNTDQLYIICIRSQNEMPVCKPWQGRVWALRTQSLGPETKKKYVRTTGNNLGVARCAQRAGLELGRHGSSED